MGMSYHIRRAEPSDIDAVSTLYGVADRFHVEGLPPVYLRPPAPARSRATLESLLADEEAALLAVCRRERVVPRDSAFGGRFEAKTRAPSALLPSHITINEVGSFLSDKLLVADAAGVLAGVIDAHLRAVAGLSQRYADIDTLVVDPAWHRAGVASALVAAVERWAWESGAREVRLDVWEFNSGALALYEGFGYRTITRRLAKPLAPPPVREGSG